MPPTALIRRSLASDAPALTALALAAKSSWGYPADLIDLWRPALTVTPDSLATRLAYVATDPAGHLLAAYALSPSRPATDLTDFWVAPTHHRRGLGRLMFHHAITTATDLGATTILIESDPHAEGFYLHLGARRIGQVPSTPPGRTLPLLEYRLPNPTTP